MFADGKEACCEAVAPFLAPGDAVGAGFSFVDEIQGGEKEERFVGAFVRRAFLDRGGARVEVVKPFDGRVQGHGGSLSGMESDGKQKRTENQMGVGETEDRRQKTGGLGEGFALGFAGGRCLVLGVWCLVFGAWLGAVAGRWLFRAVGGKWARHGGQALPGFGIFDL